MFYSHQLLARKAALGQIWMAATMHAKINRKKLNKLNIIKICEEILNPQVPMALRLSGILMGGVVIVYERKVKMLYDDVTRLVIEINEAWKVKPAVDSTVLPKGKAQAKFEAVTLPNFVDADIDQTMLFSNEAFTASRLQRMRLDDVDDQYININIDEDPSHHQADAANITLIDDFASCLDATNLFNRFERFDIGEDEEFAPQEQPTLVPSPPRQDAQSKPPSSQMSSPPPYELPQVNQPMEEQVNLQREEHFKRAEEAAGNAPEQKPFRNRKAQKKRNRVIMDDELLMIPGDIYQDWLQDPSNIISRRGTRNKSRIFNTKIAKLMEIPPVALMSGHPDEVIYSAPLMDLWKKCTHITRDTGASSGRIPPDVRENPPAHSYSPPQALSRRSVPSMGAGDFHSEVGSRTGASISVEKFRAAVGNMDQQTIVNDAFPDHRSDIPVSPAGQSSKSAPSSGSGHAIFPSPEEALPASTRARKRQYSSSHNDLGNLDPVREEGLLEQDVRGFKIPRQSQRGTPYFDSELLVETGPTQTPQPEAADPSVDSMTNLIRSHLKIHFDSHGAPPTESVDHLAHGLNRRKAAQFFYQTCVLATLDAIKVRQEEAYGDILISRGPNM